MNEDDITLDQIIAFHTLMCEAQKIIGMPRTMQTNWEMILKGTTDKHQVMMMKDKKSPTFAKGIGA